MIVKLLLESVIFLFVVFSIVGVNAMKTGKLGLIHEYPKAIQDCCRELGLIKEDSRKLTKKATIGKAGFFFVLCGVQISAFVKGMTPYPRWCWIFSLPIGMLLAMFFKVFGNQAWANALTAGWISIGNIWMFAGLLGTMKKAKKI